MKKTLIVTLAIALIAPSAFAAALTNADIIKMSEAKLDEAIILTAVENSPAEFDTSPQGLITLSGAKVGQPVISAMIKKANAPAKDAAPAAETKPATPVAAGAEIMTPSEIFMTVGGQTHPMRYINPQVRTAARVLGLGGVASYAVLRGDKAGERTSTRQPAFIVSVPNQAQPESYLTLASFAVRRNNSREVMIGGGYMSYSTGIHPDRVVAVSSEKTPDQSKAQKGFTIYKITPARPLANGEYAVILYTGEMHGLVSTWFTGTGNSYFDFGIDP
jgi:hypothetical protein